MQRPGSSFFLISGHLFSTPDCAGRIFDKRPTVVLRPSRLSHVPNEIALLTAKNATFKCCLARASFGSVASLNNIRPYLLIQASRPHALQFSPLRYYRFCQLLMVGWSTYLLRLELFRKLPNAFIRSSEICSLDALLVNSTP